MYCSNLLLVFLRTTMTMSSMEMSDKADIELATIGPDRESHNEDSSIATSTATPFTWTYASLKESTSKPLVEVLFDECRAAWWVLVITGMVWGNAGMWQRIRDSTLTIFRDGHFEYTSTAISISSSNQSTSTSTGNESKQILFRIIFYAVLKRVIIRVWFVAVRLLIAGSIGLLTFYAIFFSYFNVHTRGYRAQFVCFYVTMLIQATTTLCTTTLMYSRVHSFAPLYTIASYAYSIPWCAGFFTIAFALELLSLIYVQEDAFLIGFSNFTLLTCLMFILVDIQSSSRLMDHLLQKLNYFETRLKLPTDRIEEGVVEAMSNPMQSMQKMVEKERKEGLSTDNLVIDLQEYDLIRKEIRQRVNESWYTNAFSVTVAGLNIIMLCIASFSLMLVFNSEQSALLVLQLGKELVFLLMVFCSCATMNAKAEVFVRKLGNYVSWHEKPMSVWLYVTLNPISFKLGGYVVTWNRIALQLLSLGIGVMIGFLKTAIINSG